MKKVCEKYNEKNDVDSSYFLKKKNIWFSKCKNCINERVKCLLCQKHIKNNSFTNHKKRYHTSVVESKENYIENDNNIDHDNDIDNKNFNRTLIVGVCNSGKTYLVKNKILLSEYDNPDRQIKKLTRSSNQYPNYETTDEILSIDEYKDCVVNFDDMLE